MNPTIIRPRRLVPVVLCLAGAIVVGAAIAPEPPLDLVIRGGRVIDGGGNPWFRADVGVRGGRIVDTGRLSGRTARRTIDARDRVVAPGFVDVMGGSSVPLLLEPASAESKLRQGITTMLVGERGREAPQNERTLRQRDGSAAPSRWQTFAEYFKALEQAKVALNVVHNVSAGQVRRVVMGDEDRRPTADELSQMKALVAAAMQDGVVGLSTALIVRPATYTTTEELVELTKVAAAYGGMYLSILRNESNGVLEALDEAIHIGDAAHVAVHVYHLKAAGLENEPLVARALDRIRAARARGLDITTDVGPYVQNGVGLDMLIHPRHFAAAAAPIRGRLRHPDVRRELRTEIETTTDWQNFYVSGGRDWGHVLITDAPPGPNHELIGLTVKQVAARRGVDVWDAFFDLVQAGPVGGAVETMNLDQRRQVLRAPFVSIHTDAEPVDPAHPSGNHPKAFGSFPRILAQFVRDDHVLSLEEAIRKMTSLPANLLMASDRGRIAPGMAADLLVFDPARVQDTATFGKPHAYATGIDDVIVNGEVVIDEGRMTGVNAGVVIRHQAVRADSRTVHE